MPPRETGLETSFMTCTSVLEEKGTSSLILNVSCIIAFGKQGGREGLPKNLPSFASPKHSEVSGAVRELLGHTLSLEPSQKFSKGVSKQKMC